MNAKRVLKKISFTILVILSAAGLFVLSGSIVKSVSTSLSEEYDTSSFSGEAADEENEKNSASERSTGLFNTVNSNNLTFACVIIFMACSAAVIAIFIIDREKPLWFAAIYAAAILIGIFVPLITAFICIN